MIYPPRELSQKITKKHALDCYSASMTNGNLLNAYLNTVVLLRGKTLPEVINQVLDDISLDYSPEYFFEPSIVEKLTLEEISVIAKRVITTRYKLLFSKPFKLDKSITIDKFWEQSSEWIADGGVVVFGNDNYWLTFYEITENQVFFAGSSKANIVNRDELNSSISHSPYYHLQSVRFIRGLEVIYE